MQSCEEIPIVDSFHLNLVKNLQVSSCQMPIDEKAIDIGSLTEEKEKRNVMAVGTRDGFLQLFNCL